MAAADGDGTSATGATDATAGTHVSGRTARAAAARAAADARAQLAQVIASYDAAAAKRTAYGITDAEPAEVGLARALYRATFRLSRRPTSARSR